MIRGGDGNDFLRGGNGNDRVYGENGNDNLFGDAGLDSLIGGVNGNDVLRGGAQSDRLLVFEGDNITDFGSRDAQINFRSQDSLWNNQELEVVDTSFEILHFKTNNGRLLRDPLADLPIAFIKVNTLPPSLRLGTSELATVTTNVQDPITGEVEPVTVSERQIRIADFNENDPDVQELHKFEITREIAHSWASDEAIAAAKPAQTSYFTTFEWLSSWTSETPDDVVFFTRSDDNTQWYRTTSVFVDDPLATFNSREDFASVWRLVLTPGTTSEQSLVPLKTDLIDELFALLSSP